MPLDALGKEIGWISKWALQFRALKADGIGRQAVEDYYLIEQMIRANTDNTLNVARIGRWQYDFALLGGAVSPITLSGVALPAKALVLGGLLYVDTLLTGGAGATGALNVEGADDLVAATVISGVPWSTTGKKAITPVFTAATAVLTTVARTPVFTIAVNPVTAGKFTLWLYYFATD